MDHHATDLVLATALPIVVAALVVGIAVWQPSFLRRAVERHPAGIDRGYRVAMLALFVVLLAAGAWWTAWIFLPLALIGTALGRRRRTR